MRALLPTLILSMAVSLGCTHKLEILREGEWAVYTQYGSAGEGPALTPRPLVVGTIQGPPGGTEEQILMGIEETLYAAYQQGGDPSEEVVVDIFMSTEFSGDWLNLIIAVPGGFIFLPAALGFRYHMTYYFNITYHFPQGPPAYALIEAGYLMKHCNFIKGMLTTGALWLWYPFAPVAIISAPFMIGYSDSLTPYVLEAARGDVVDVVEYVTVKIHRELDRILSTPPP